MKVGSTLTGGNGWLTVSAMDFEFTVAGLMGSRESIREEVESGDLSSVG